MWVGWPEDWLADYSECQRGAGDSLADAGGEVWRAFQAAGVPSIHDGTPLGSMCAEDGPNGASAQCSVAGLMADSR